MFHSLFSVYFYGLYLLFQTIECKKKFSNELTNSAFSGMDDDIKQEGVSSSDPPPPKDNYGIMDSKKKPNRLIVDDSLDFDDNSTVHLSEAKMSELNLYAGDTVNVKGKKGKSTVCVAVAAEPGWNMPDSNVRMNKCVRKNLRVRLGDCVTITALSNVPYGNRVHFSPIDDTIEGVTGSLFDVYLKDYFNESFRPVTEGDLFLVRAAMHPVEFKVVACDPSPSCIVVQDTVITCEGDRLVSASLDNTLKIWSLRRNLDELILWSFQNPIQILFILLSLLILYLSYKR